MFKAITDTFIIYHTQISKYQMGLPQQAYDGRGGATPHLRTIPKQNDPLFIIGKGMTPDKKKLYKYFPLLVGRSSKTLYFQLLVVYANPLRTTRHLLTIGLSNNKTTQKNLNILCDLGYVQQENKPRKIIVFEAYTLDKVYRITSKGVKALSAITGY